MVEIVVPLTVRDLTREDLPSCAWSGSARNLAQLGKTLERARRGEIDYLAVCPPSGLPSRPVAIAHRGASSAKPPAKKR